jgi:hypothetical protein
MKKIAFLFCFVTPFLLLTPLWGLSIDDFDRIVDFSITMEELSKALETNDYSQIDKNKFVILSGIASVIRPYKSFFFLLNPEDITNVPSFINKLKMAKDGVSEFLFKQFSPELQEEITTFDGSSGEARGLIRDITNELKRVYRRKSIYDKARFAGVQLTDELANYAQRDLEAEEMAFVNRLLTEAAYPSFINKVTVQVEVVYGVWIGYDEVKSYKSIIEFQGPECFKIFNRQKPERGSREMIPVNSTIIVVAKIIKPFIEDGKEAGWFLEGLYIREVR